MNAINIKIKYILQTHTHTHEKKLFKEGERIFELGNWNIQSQKEKNGKKFWYDPDRANFTISYYQYKNRLTSIKKKVSIFIIISIQRSFKIVKIK